MTSGQSKGTHREIVVEIERIRTIRKRCRTHIHYCSDCGAESDFITLLEAAALFEVADGIIKSCVRHHICSENGNEDGMLICLSSLLSVMQSTGESRSKEVASAVIRRFPAVRRD